MIGSFFLLFSILFGCTKLSYADKCAYYPRFPDNTPSYIDCQNGCCGGSTPVTSNNLCCISNTPSWIAYPIVAIVVTLTSAIVLAVICTKYKRPVQRTRVVRQEPWATQMSQNNYSSSINNGFNPDNFYIQKNDPPPSYEDIEFVKSNDSSMNKNKNLDGQMIMPVLPGSFLPADEAKKEVHETQNI